LGLAGRGGGGEITRYNKFFAGGGIVRGAGGIKEGNGILIEEL